MRSRDPALRCPSRALLVALLFLWGAPAWAADEAGALLMRMAEAMSSQAYEGTLVYEHGDRLESMAIVHGYIDGREYERLRVLSGEPFEIIREGKKVTCVWPAERRMLVDQRPGDLLAPKPPRNLRSLPAHYRAELGGTGRIAEREGRILRIEGEDRYRYGYRMWIDMETGLLLRSDLTGREGMVYERIMFTHIQPLDTVGRERFEPSLEGEKYSRHGDPAADTTRLEDPEWEMTDLPPGFRLVSHRNQAMPPHGEAVQHSVYTDGLASVSIFVEPAGTDAMPLRGLSRMGAVHAFGREIEGHQVTVVGEVPAATVKHVARGVRRR
jgi:sigma-E factor negative regulatory protein RseB